MASTINATPTSSGLISTADNTGVLALQTGGTTAVTVDASQNVGIGTATPAYKLSVNGRISYAGIIGEGADTTLSSTGTSLQLGLSSTWTENRFYTGGSERMRINSSGDVFIGCTTNPNSTTAGRFIGGTSYDQRSCGTTTTTYQHFYFTNGNGNVGTITTNGSSTAYNTSSDYRLKENIVPMTGALDKVALLKPVTYKWKADGSNGEGFIAHELQEIMPDCVTGVKDEVDAESNPIHQAVDTSFLVATLTAAIQEQQALITQLQADVAALKGVA